MSRKVLVCGGRDFADVGLVNDVLNNLHRDERFSALIHGHAPGADSLAAQWAASRNITRLGFRADWKKHGKAAGPFRNQKMLDEGQPDLVVAFPGGRGTADMVRRAKLADVHVIQIVPT